MSKEKISGFRIINLSPKEIDELWKSAQKFREEEWREAKRQMEEALKILDQQPSLLPPPPQGVYRNWR